MSDDCKPAVILDSAALSQLENAEAKALLDTIDNLRELQVGDIVQLPQIIVVGNQSAGKSSVLEAISGVRWPKKGGICTRFATELVLRRASQTSIDVSIEFAPSSRSGEDVDSALPFRKTSFDSYALPAIIEDARERMSRRAGDNSGFFKDVLRVKITSPDVYPVTLVDLPGFFSTATAEQSEEDRIIVNQLIDKYMAQKNSIILTVVNASTQISQHAALGEALRHDPNRSRTVGVITKPDVPEKDSFDERAALQLAQNREGMHNLDLGWHVLRNLSEAEVDSGSSDRDAKEEKFFQNTPWSSIAISSRGIGNLRVKLSRVLLEHIRKSLPGLIQDIEVNLRSRQEELDRLGKARSSTEDMRSYLLGIADDFQRLARDGVGGHYRDSFFGDLSQDQRKLRAQIRNLNNAFYVTLAVKGSTYDIQRDDPNNDWSDNNGSASEPSHGDEEDVPKYLRAFVDLYHFPDPHSITEAELNEELQMLAAANQGMELPGSPNSDLAVQLFKIQAAPWERVAQHHVDLVIQYSKSFVEQLFGHVVGSDTKTTGSILHLVDLFFDGKEKILKDKLGELVRPYLAGFGVPLEAEFREKLSMSTLLRHAAKVADFLEEPGSISNKAKDVLNRKKNILAVMESKAFGVSDFSTEHIVDAMEALYEISRRTFSENVINLALESCLILDIPNILTPRTVDRMSETELRELVAESEDVQARRNMLQHKIQILREGLAKCRRQRPRDVTVLPSNFPSLSSTPAAKSATARLSPAPASTPKSSPHPVPVSTPERATISPFKGLSSATSFKVANGAAATPAKSSESLLNAPVFAFSTPLPGQIGKLPALSSGSPSSSSTNNSQSSMQSKTTGSAVSSPASVFSNLTVQPPPSNIFGPKQAPTEQPYGKNKSKSTQSSGASDPFWAPPGGTAVFDIWYPALQAVPSTPRLYDELREITHSMDNKTKGVAQHICFSSQLGGWSPEELRLKHEFTSQFEEEL